MDLPHFQNKRLILYYIYYYITYDIIYYNIFQYIVI